MTHFLCRVSQIGVLHLSHAGNMQEDAPLEVRPRWAFNSARFQSCSDWYSSTFVSLDKLPLDSVPVFETGSESHDMITRHQHALPFGRFAVLLLE